MASPWRKTNTKTSTVTINLTQVALSDLKYENRIFDLIEKGGSKAITKLKNELEQNPK